MPREFLIKMTAPEELTGVAPGTILRRYSVDCDEYVAKKLGVVVDENPAPRSYLLSNDGTVEIGVRSANQAQMTEQERQAEQQFLKAQIAALDQKHEAELAKKAAADALAGRRKAVAHE